MGFYLKTAPATCDVPAAVLSAPSKTLTRRFSRPLQNAYRAPRLQERGLRFYSANLSRWISRDPIGDVAVVGARDSTAPRNEHMKTRWLSYAADAYGFLENKPTCAIDPVGLTVYYCCGVVDTWKHCWVCSGTNNCAGLQPAEKSWKWIKNVCCIGEGKVTKEEFRKDMCRPMDVDGFPGCDQSKYEKCIERNLIEGKKGRYGLLFGNCVSWARGLILHCQAEACGVSPTAAF